MAATPAPTTKVKDFPARDHDHGPCVATALARAREAFEARSLRMTDLRQLVLEEIVSSHRAVGAYDLIDRLAAKGQRLAPISVYRALDALLDVGVIHRLESRNAFFACHRRHADGEALVNLVCETCGRVAEVPAPQVFVGLRGVTEATSFKASRTLVEITGECADCRSTQPRAAADGQK